jgi:hypothetical protein
VVVVGEYVGTGRNRIPNEVPLLTRGSGSARGLANSGGFLRRIRVFGDRVELRRFGRWTSFPYDIVVVRRFWWSYRFCEGFLFANSDPESVVSIAPRGASDLTEYLLENGFTYRAIR